MKFSHIKIIILIIISLSSPFVKAQKRERKSVFSVTEVVIKNKNLVDFIRERVFKVADSLIEPQYPDIHYVIEFEKKPWIKSYDCNVAIRAYGEPEGFCDNGSGESIYEYEDNSYISFIDGRTILVRTDSNNPYIEITKKKIRVNQKSDLWLYPGIIWKIAMKGERLLAVNLELDSRPNIEQDKRIRRDFYLFPKECIKEIRVSRKPKLILLDSISPPPFINIPNIIG